MEELSERFLIGNIALVIQEIVPEAGIEQVPREVLLAAAVEVNGHPVLKQLVIGKFFVVVRVAVAEEVP